MKTFLVNFRVEQTHSGSFPLQAESAEDARRMFMDALVGKNARVDRLRLVADLDMEQSQDRLVDIIDTETDELFEAVDNGAALAEPHKRAAR